jgi:poly-gamma-glutamate synthesis protein (capsule biosynthesis protein)
VNSLLSTYTGFKMKRINFSLIFTRHLFPKLLFAVLCFLVLAGSCTTIPVSKTSENAAIPKPELPSGYVQKSEPEQKPENLSLDLTFAGDIMAHAVNYSMPDYNRIYDAVRPLLLHDTLSFANFEAPVDSSLPLTTYPRFNVHPAYLDAAIKGGFEVFSLANNHANDQGSSGILGTLSSFSETRNKIYFSGLRNKTDNSLEPVRIKKNGWNILFLSVTEILNSLDDSRKLVYYVPPREKDQAEFLGRIRQLREQYPSDLFILSIHLDEPEYVRTVSDAKKKWFSQIAAAGVDIVWGHHPHVMQKWEVEDIHEGTISRQVLFMYSMGNLISGQRYVPDLKNPDALREYTGDEVLLSVKVSRTGASGINTISVSPVLVTNYTDPDQGAVLRLFDERFIASLPEIWKTYFRQRAVLMYAYLPLLPSRQLEGILNK